MDTHFIETREFEWKLHNFTKELLKANKIVWSDSFSIFLDFDETKWKFDIEPKEGAYGVFLHLENSEVDDFTVKFNVQIRKLNNEKYLDWHFVRTRNEFKKIEGYGWEKYIIVATICDHGVQFLENKTLTLRLKIELTKKKESENPQANNEYQKMCIDYFETKSYSDFKLVCSDGVEIKVHRFVLAGISSVMKEIFDAKPANSKGISIKDIDGETMTEILRYIYTRKVQNLKDLAEKILYGADKYELDKLKKLCVASMIENLSVNNALDYFVLADQYDLKVLQERSAMFIKSHHKDLSKNWNKLTKKFLIMLLDFYHHNPGVVKIFESTL